MDSVRAFKVSKVHTRVCSKCKQLRSLSDFSIKKRAGGYTSKDISKVCKDCEQYLPNKLVGEFNKDILDGKPNSFWARVYTTYGLTQVKYREMLDEQKWACAICLEPFTLTPFIDHDHKTGKVRGLLCSFCNSGLGYFKDDIGRMINAADYIKSRSSQP